MRFLRVGWYAIYATLCVYAHPTKVPKNLKLDDLDAMGTSYSFKDTETDKLSKIIKTDFDEFDRDLIPMKSVTTGKNDFSSLRLPLEPDAEMLPAHYTGVKSPGVDHMELKHSDSHILETNPKMMIVAKPEKFEQVVSAEHASSKQAAQGEKGERGRKKIVEYETGNKGEQENEKMKTEYSEAAGKKKTHSEEGNNVKDMTEKIEGEKGVTYEVEGKHKKGHDVAGYHNVYHKDEYKKDADFYDNDHQGGHFKKHGRYNEKFTAAEGVYKKSGNSDSGFHQTELNKEGISEKARVNQEAEGHDARQGYDGFFDNFEGFGKEGGSVQGKKFGFVNGKTR